MEVSMRVTARSLAVVSTACVLMLGAVACSKDAEVLGFVVDFDSFSNEIVKRVKEANDPSAGVDDAQAYLDSKKAEIKTKLAGIKQVRSFQLSEDTRKKIEASFKKNAEAVAGLMVTHMMRMATDHGFQAKLEKLVKSYQEVLTD
jgi:F0F1-type ATP synthase assembly protein I